VSTAQHSTAQHTSTVPTPPTGRFSPSWARSASPPWPRLVRVRAPTARARRARSVCSLCFDRRLVQCQSCTNGIASPPPVTPTPSTANSRRLRGSMSEESMPTRSHTSATRTHTSHHITPAVLRRNISTLRVKHLLIAKLYNVHVRTECTHAFRSARTCRDVRRQLIFNCRVAQRHQHTRAHHTSQHYQCCVVLKALYEC
jgi:hypothetical protein